MANYAKTSVADGPRAVLHDEIGLTGAEVSINVLPAGASIPFVHSHKQNEEIYGILEGSGKAEIDGDTVALKAGDWLRIAPSAYRSRKVRSNNTPPTTQSCDAFEAAKRPEANASGRFAYADDDIMRRTARS